MSTILDFFARDYEVLETVYNKEKKVTQFVLAKIPFNRKTELGIPKMKKAYFCSEFGTNTWTVEMSENLRPATIFERHF